MSRLRSLILVACSLIVGAALWWKIGQHGGVSFRAVAGLVAAAALALVPASRGRIGPWLRKLRHPSPRASWWITVGVALVSGGYIAATAFWTQDRDLVPKFHDEHMHLLQIQMLARGMLWTAPHPLADFFETFHVLTTPVYASIYFPGTALMYAPSVWLKLPFWFLPLCVASACCATLYRIVLKMLDGEAALLAVLMLVSLRWFRYLGLMVMSHSVMLLLGLLTVWAWTRWRRGKRPGWAAAIGALAGWAAITRPVDALCYSIPVGVAMLIALLRREGGAPIQWKRLAASAAAVVAGATPFLSLQVIENIGITGNPLKTPYRLYADLYTPQMSFGFHEFDPKVRPKTSLQQRLDYYDLFTIPAARQHRPDRMVRTWLLLRFPILAKVTTPNRLMLLIAPAGLLVLCRRRRLLRPPPRVATAAVLVSVLPLWIVMYAAFSYLLAWYCIVPAPATIALVLLGRHALQAAAAAAWRETARVFLTLAIVALSLASLPEFDRELLDDGFPAPFMRWSYLELPRLVQEPAIVLFRYATGVGFHEEPVYNVDVVNPDDAPIIRAHDLGLERDRELFDYYARRQPDRNVYLFDRESKRLVPLGNVAELSRRLAATRPATPPATPPATTAAPAQ